MAEKYKQIILNFIKYGADHNGKITKGKLGRLVYLADFIWYYLNLVPMSDMKYRKLTSGEVADGYNHTLNNMEKEGLITKERTGGALVYFALAVDEVPVDNLSRDELSLIKKISEAWRGKSTRSISSFTHELLPWQICRHGEIIPFGLITQEDPSRVYKAMKVGD